MAEENIRPVTFPVIPTTLDDDMRNYLIELERTLQESLKGSIYIETVLQTGIIGN